jgi:hypothetical protein
MWTFKSLIGTAAHAMTTGAGSRLSIAPPSAQQSTDIRRTRPDVDGVIKLDLLVIKLLTSFAHNVGQLYQRFDCCAVLPHAQRILRQVIRCQS